MRERMGCAHFVNDELCVSVPTERKAMPLLQAKGTSTIMKL